MPRTNLQTLTAEELAPIICDSFFACEYCIYKDKECPNFDCENNIYKWLKSKAEEEEK